MKTDLTLEAGLPANVHAEKVILGAVLLDNQAWPEVRQSLRPDDFSLDAHRRIVLRMRYLYDSGRTIDIVTLANALGRHTEVEAVGGVAYLASLTEGLPRRPVIEDYIRILKDKSILRRMMASCSQVIARCAEQAEPALEIVGSVMAELEQMIAPSNKPSAAHVENFVLQTLQEINEEYHNKLSPCIPSGNAWFDHKTGGGYRHGKITIVAARPKIGKTGWGVRSVAENLKAGRKCVVFSLEMTKSEFLRWLVPHFVDISNKKVMRPWEMTPDEHALVTQGLSKIVELPLLIFDGKLTCDELCWTIDRETRKGEEVLFLLDHFKLIAGGDRDIRKRYVENSGRLRDKIKHKRAALLQLMQLNPVPREIADKRPIEDDLKESKDPAEDCYAMLLLHRYRDKETNKITRKSNLNLALIRGGGSPGNVDCEFDTKKLCFEAHAELIDDDDDNYFS